MNSPKRRRSLPDLDPGTPTKRTPPTPSKNFNDLSLQDGLGAALPDVTPVDEINCVDDVVKQLNERKGSPEEVRALLQEQPLPRVARILGRTLFADQVKCREWTRNWLDELESKYLDHTKAICALLACVLQHAATITLEPHAKLAFVLGGDEILYLQFAQVPLIPFMCMMELSTRDAWTPVANSTGKYTRCTGFKYTLEYDTFLDRLGLVNAWLLNEFNVLLGNERPNHETLSRVDVIFQRLIWQKTGNSQDTSPSATDVETLCDMRDQVIALRNQIKRPTFLPRELMAHAAI